MSGWLNCHKISNYKPPQLQNFKLQNFKLQNFKLPQNCRLSHGHNPTSHPSYPCTMGTRTQNSSWWAMRQQYPHTEATQLSWPSPSSWQSKTWPRQGTPLFGQGQSRHGRSSRTCWLPVFKAFRRSQSQLRLCSSAHKTMRNTFKRMSKGSCDWEHKRPQFPMRSSLRPWSRVFGQDLRPNTLPGNPLKLWRSYFRRWMSTSELIMTSDKEGRKLTDFPKWLGASKEESTLGMLDQSTAPVRLMTKEASFRGHSTPHSLRDSSKAPSGHQLQGAEAAGLRRKIWDQPRKMYCLFCGEDKGHATRTCQITILKQKEIAEAEARQNQPKQVLYTASCHSPYMPEYVGNQPASYVASASHSLASWP
jgi:hypothetical protein